MYIRFKTFVKKKLFSFEKQVKGRDFHFRPYEKKKRTFVSYMQYFFPTIFSVVFLSFHFFVFFSSLWLFINERLCSYFFLFLPYITYIHTYIYVYVCLYKCYVLVDGFFFVIFLLEYTRVVRKRITISEKRRKKQLGT